MNTIWLIGAGPMAIDYAKVLDHQKQKFITIGRSEDGAQRFLEATGQSALYGGLEKFLESKPGLPEAAIVAVSIENLAESCMQLLNYGVKKILLEKPGVAYAHEIENLNTMTKEKNATVVLAYNRRFYASVLKVQEMIKEDGEVKSFHFEFTEWSHQIRNLKKHKAELENWFLGNSTHVIDTAFYLCGVPTEMTCYQAGALDWHSSGSVYSGAGISDKNALFSYIANWEAPGRWNLEIMTKKNRYIFKPMEKLQVMKIGSIAVEFVTDIDYSLDEKFKPGLYLQTKAFLEADISKFITIAEQKDIIQKFYSKISNYN